MNKVSWKMLLWGMGCLTAIHGLFFGEILTHSPIALILFYLSYKEEN